MYVYRTEIFTNFKKKPYMEKTTTKFTRFKFFTIYLLFFSVYMIIGMFCFASFIAVYSCLEPIVMYSYEVCPRFIFQFPSCNLYCCVINLELRQFLIMSFSLAITAGKNSKALNNGISL